MTISARSTSSPSPPLPRFIRSKYLQYKLDTEKLSTWLGRTAVQYGYDITRLARASSSETSAEEQNAVPQAKNAAKNARKKANRAKTQASAEAGPSRGQANAQAGDSSTTGQATPPQCKGKYALEIRQYPQAAQVLADNAVPIPDEFGRLLNRCITLRSGFTERLTTTQSRHTHEHFVRVLRQVRTILGVTATALDSEDLSDIELPPPPKPSAAAPDTSEATFISRLDRAEALHALSLFMDDVASVRSYVKGIWADYQRREVELVTAAVVTNTALELLRQPHDDLMVRITPLLGEDIGFMMAVLYNLLGHDIPGHDIGMPLFTSISDTDTQDIALYDQLMVPTMQIVGGMADILEDGCLPMYTPGHFGRYAAASLASSTSARHRWHQCQILLIESLTDYLVLLRMGRLKPPPRLNPSGSRANLFYLDQTAVELERFAQTKQQTLFTVLVLQVFLDVNMVLSTSAKTALGELRTESQRMITGIEARRAVDGGALPRTWPRGNERMLDRFLDECRYWRRGDHIGAFRKGLAQTDAFDHDAKSLFLERNPTLCGLLTFRLQLHYRDIGLSIASAWDSVIFTSHLYNAGKVAGVAPGGDPPLWHDLEFVNHLVGEELLYSGVKPATLDDCNARFLVMAGYSSIALQIDPMLETNPFVHEGVRKLKDQSEILPVFLQKYKDDLVSATRFDMSIIKSLLSKIADSTHVRAQRIHDEQQLSLVQLLAVLEMGLERDSEAIRFDWVALHVRCMEALKAVRTASHASLVDKFGLNYLENDSQLPWLTGMILSVAMMSQRSAERLGLQPRGGGRNVSSRLLVGATDALKEYTEVRVGTGHRGSVEVDRLGASLS